VAEKGGSEGAESIPAKIQWPESRSLFAVCSLWLATAPVAPGCIPQQDRREEHRAIKRSTTAVLSFKSVLRLPTNFLRLQKSFGCSFNNAIEPRK
jgi:hypothetical protein